MTVLMTPAVGQGQTQAPILAGGNLYCRRLLNPLDLGQGKIRMQFLDHLDTHREIAKVWCHPWTVSICLHHFHLGGARRRCQMTIPQGSSRPLQRALHHACRLEKDIQEPLVTNPCLGWTPLTSQEDQTHLQFIHEHHLMVLQEDDFEA